LYQVKLQILILWILCATNENSNLYATNENSNLCATNENSNLCAVCNNEHNRTCATNESSVFCATMNNNVLCALSATTNNNKESLCNKLGREVLKLWMKRNDFLMLSLPGGRINLKYNFN
jgi:hypothetical protein